MGSVVYHVTHHGFCICSDSSSSTASPDNPELVKETQVRIINDFVTWCHSNRLQSSSQRSIFLLVIENQSVPLKRAFVRKKERFACKNKVSFNILQAQKLNSHHVYNI